ncbi:Rv3852 family protein [Mycobacterium palustre]|uniref:Nucleoid-structuring protein H-NS n=1 Tax=Mycobacterium palustre TaxID=153971 RepID=A0A1X2A1B6_9MYCO|nr:nucleoid-structuring protein H-NS [Mycobacterium palustre]MCV7100269.1 nucleoid-structuring protein H-NS [Mycobacterium palustre]ORW34826.1 nucleoid-structuring protein H-NS [Mycobacterium palustre]ORW34840.1 nucleoid-structuring protein H-NS [Mycobacterium palustre]
MADPQDQPNGEPEGAATPPEKKPPAKAAKKAPAKKAPAKKAVARKTPAKKAPAKKAPAKKAPAAGPEPARDAQQRIETNGQLAAAAKDAAAQAKSTVEAAPNPVSPAVPAREESVFPTPWAVALAVSLLAVLLIRQLRRR